MIIRPLTTLEECRRSSRSKRSVWGYTDAEDVVPPPVLIVSIKRGGILLGAFDDGRRDEGLRLLDPAAEGRAAHAVVAHARRDAGRARSAGLGARLKLAQRERALRDGPRPDRVDLRSAPGDERAPQFREARAWSSRSTRRTSTASRAARCTAATPTDRFVAEWHIATPHVERRIAATARTADARRVAWPPRRSSILRGRRRVARARRRRTSISRTAACWSRSRPASPTCRSHSPELALRVAHGDAPDLPGVLRARLPRRGFLPVARRTARAVPAGARAESRRSSTSSFIGSRPSVRVSLCLARRPGQPASAEHVQVDVEHRLAGVGVAVEHRPVAAIARAHARRRAPRRGASSRRPARHRPAARSFSVAMWRRGTTRTCVGACGLMSLNATSWSSW